MLERIREFFTGKRMTSKEIQAAILCKEAMMGQEVFQLDAATSVQLIKEVGCPVREFNGTRHDN